LILRVARVTRAARTYAHTYARVHSSTYLGLLFFASKFTREKRLRRLSRLISSTVKFKFKPTYRNTCIRHVRIRARVCARARARTRVSQDRSAASSRVGDRPRWADCRSAIGNIFQRREFIGRLPGNI